MAFSRGSARPRGLAAGAQRTLERHVGALKEDTKQLGKVVEILIGVRNRV